MAVEPVQVDISTADPGDAPGMIARPSVVDVDLPEVLRSSRRDELLRQFTDEFAPVGPTELILTASLARHSAGMEQWEEGSGAVTRQAARRLPQIIAGAAAGETNDAVLAASLGTDATERCEKQSVLRSRLFLRTLETLMAVQAERRDRAWPASMPPFGFRSEAECEAYLVDRFRRGQVPCPKCGGIQGCWIESRKCRECRGCGAQSGLRVGTVMARSAVPLLTWFNGIRLVLWRPTIRVAELAAELGLRRIATAGGMAGKIRAATAADNAGELLAGLDQVYRRSTTT